MMAQKKRHMRKRIGWTRRDPDGGRYKVQVWFFAGTWHWESQRRRYEPWTRYTPDSEDWDQLEADVSRRIARGLLEAEELRLLRELRAVSELPKSDEDR